MFEHKKIQVLDDFFIELKDRSSKGIYFYRVNGYNDKVGEFLKKYYEAARTSGVIIEGRIANPDGKNLSYYNEIMGTGVQFSLEFFKVSLKKWLPRMNEYQRNTMAASIYDTLDMLKKAGKNENMLKNAYIKFMCWLYYKFERIVSQLGDNKVPKILYEGEISNYELLLMEILAKAGCDVVLLQSNGDAAYLELDPNSVKSECLILPKLGDFPPDFSVKWIRDEIQSGLAIERLYGVKPKVMNCTNAWISGKGLEDFKAGIQTRGNDSKLFYNCFYRINGVEDKLTYMNELYQFEVELKNSGRKVVIVDEVIPQPSTAEIAAIKRSNYTQKEDMILNLSANIQYTANAELKKLMVKAFVDIILEEANAEGVSLNKLTNRAVILLCLLKRYQNQLFGNWRMPDISCFIFMGGCQSEYEAMFLRFLARLPIDVLILNPNLNKKCCLSDKLLYEVSYTESLNVNRFPKENAEVQIGTAAYHAERELDTLMYQDTGMYRNKQYGKANSVTLQTMYEEIALLWKEELRYRPNFGTTDDVVTMPVIFAKISGVKTGNALQYWETIKALMVGDHYLIKDVPFVKSTDANPIKPHMTEFFKNGKLQKSKIKAHQSYQYGVLREEIQEHILDKLQILIDRKLIKGTFENGTEYTIVATVLNMNKEIIRMIQKFDFTKVNPKIIYINTTENNISLEDTILMTFLHLIGFDVVFFVPTGYMTVEKFFNEKLLVEHQLDEYMYDLTVPDFRNISINKRLKWRDKIFRRRV